MLYFHFQSSWGVFFSSFYFFFDSLVVQLINMFWFINFLSLFFSQNFITHILLKLLCSVHYFLLVFLKLTWYFYFFTSQFSSHSILFPTPYLKLTSGFRMAVSCSKKSSGYLVRIRKLKCLFLSFTHCTTLGKYVCYSKCHLRTNNIGYFWEFVEMQNLRFHPRPTELKSKIFTLTNTVKSLSLKLNFLIYKV